MGNTAHGAVWGLRGLGNPNNGVDLEGTGSGAVPDAVQRVIVIPSTSMAVRALGKGATRCKKEYKTLPSAHFPPVRETTVLASRDHSAGSESNLTGYAG